VWAVCYVAALPLQAVLFSATGHSGTDPDQLPTSVTILGILCLWVPFSIGLVVHSRTAGSARFAADYRLRARWIDLIGLPIGVVGQLVLVPLLFWALRLVWPDSFSTSKVEERATELWDRAHGAWAVALILVVAVGAPLIEELVYRAMIQQSLQARLNEVLAVVTSAAFFAAIHLQPVEFPGLFLIGLVLGVLYQRTGRLAAPILAHLAFNATGLVLVAR
jgi:uncharacterized protein